MPYTTTIVLGTPFVNYPYGHAVRRIADTVCWISDGRMQQTEHEIATTHRAGIDSVRMARRGESSWPVAMPTPSIGAGSVTEASRNVIGQSRRQPASANRHGAVWNRKTAQERKRPGAPTPDRPADCVVMMSDLDR